MGSSKTRLALAEAERTIRMQTATIKALQVDLAAAQATARRLSEAEQSAHTLAEQRDRLIQLCDRLGGLYNAADRRAWPNEETPVFEPASTIALDAIRWAEWIDREA